MHSRKAIDSYSRCRAQLARVGYGLVGYRAALSVEQNGEYLTSAARGLGIRLVQSHAELDKPEARCRLAYSTSQSHLANLLLYLASKYRET